MKRVALGLFALAMAVVQAPPAMATSITGHASIAGNDMYTLTGVTFIDAGFVSKTTDGLSAMKRNFITLGSFKFATAAGTTLFDFKIGTTTIDFTLLTAMLLASPPGFQHVMGTGVLTETGYDPTNYIFRLTSNTKGAQTSYGLTLAPASAIPEPATLLLIGTGLLGLAGLVFRRAKKPNSTIPC